VGALLGIDIGGTNLTAAIVSSEGAVAAFDVVAWSGGAPDEAVSAIAAQRDRLVAETGAKGIEACGCGCAGLVNHERGVVHASPNLPTWHDVQLARALQAALGIPTVVENDANVAAYAEYVAGAARGAANAESIVRRAVSLIEAGRPSSLSAINKLTAKNVGDAAHRGDSVALEAVTEAGRILGVGLANIVQLLDPDVIVIGGGVAEIGEPLLAAAREELAARVAAYHSTVVRVVRAELGELAGVVGAALLARDGLRRR
jgi:glucokinase